MLITRQSPFTGKDTTMDLPITEEQLHRFKTDMRSDLTQIFPTLTADQREFLKTGITPDDWTGLGEEENQNGNQD